MVRKTHPTSNVARVEQDVIRGAIQHYSTESWQASRNGRSKNHFNIHRRDAESAEVIHTMYLVVLHLWVMAVLHAGCAVRTMKLEFDRFFRYAWRTLLQH